MLHEYQRALVASEARFRTLIEKNADGILVVRRDGVIDYANQAAEALLGRPAEELVGQMFGVPVGPGETTEIDVVRGGSTRVAEMRVVQIDWEGEPAFLASLRDTTERKRARDALSFLAEASRVLAGSLDPEATLTSVARLAVQHLADWCFIDLLDGDATVRRRAAQRGPGGGPVWAATLEGRFVLGGGALGLPRVLATGQREVHPEVSEEVLAALALHPDQLPRWRELGCRAALLVPLPGPPDRGPVGAITFVATGSGRRCGPAEQMLAQDLTQRAGLALDNARLYQESRDAVRRRDDFLAMLAHELRNPLAPILHAAQTLRLQGRGQSAVARAAAVVERQGQHLARLVDDLLDLSRVIHGKIELRRQPLELSAVVAEAVETSRPWVNRRQQRLTVKVARPLYVEGDPTRLAQVLANLLNNASRYSPPGGTIELTAAAEGPDVVVRVRDDGVGIPPEMLRRVFDPFTQVDPSLERSQGGLGIGLALVQSLVQLHGGTVTAHSEGRGQGSEFVLWLKRLEPTMITKPVVMQAAPGAMPPRRILLVEDNTDARVMLRSLLELWGHEVAEEPDGVRGLEQLCQQPPDVALIDIGLPGLDGYQLARQVRERPELRGVRLIALTGYGQSADRARALEAGFDAHLVKPVDLGELERLLAESSLPLASPRI